MIPGNAFTQQALVSAFRAPNNLSYNPLEQVVWGGVSLGDASKGRLFKYWVITYSNNTIQVSPQGQASVFSLIVSGVLSVSLAFDSNMSLVVSYTKSDGGYLYYFDAITSAFKTKFVPGATSTRVCVDDAREFYSSQSDIIFAYTVSQKLYYTMQRERYEVERFIGDAVYGLIRVGQTVSNRLRFETGVNYNYTPIENLTNDMKQPSLINVVGELRDILIPIINSFTSFIPLIEQPVLQNIVSQIYQVTQPAIESVGADTQAFVTPVLSDFTGILSENIGNNPLQNRIVFKTDFNNQSGIIKDEFNNPIIPYGNVELTTFDNKNVLYNAGDFGNGLSVPISGINHPLNLQTGDFTIESWIYLLESSETKYGLWDWGGGYLYSWPSIRVQMYGTTSVSIGLRSANTEDQPDIAYFVPVINCLPGYNQWFHLALTREGSNFRLWASGVQVYEVQSSLPLHSSSDTLSGMNIGSTGPDNRDLPKPSFGAKAYYGDFRVTRMCRYSQNFQPSTIDL